MDNKRWLTVYQVAEMLDVHPQTVRRWVLDGKLPAYKIAGSLRIRAEDIDTTARPV